MAGEFYLLMGAGGIVAMGTAVYFIQKNKTDEKPQQVTFSPSQQGENNGRRLSDGREEVDLEATCDIWTDKIIPLVQASILWAEPPERKDLTIARPKFKHSEIDTFYAEMVENRKSVAGKKRALITKILELIDEHGDCQSVVRDHKYADNDNKRDDTSYRLLSIIPLYKHLLSVSRTMVRRVGRETLVPDALIVSLAHDLGKIPKFHTNGYATGDHPRLSAFCIAEMKEFQELGARNKEELLSVVKAHHDLNASNPITQLLQMCDGLVRNIELDELLKTEVPATLNTTKPKSPTDAGLDTAAIKWVPKEPATKTPEMCKTDSIQENQPPVSPTSEEQQLPMETTQEPPPKAEPTVAPQPAAQPKESPVEVKQPARQGSGYIPKREDIPWFNPDKYLEALKPWINYVHEKRWGAVSMPDAMVYVNGDCLWGVLNEIVPTEFRAEYMNAAAVESRKRDILYSVVWELSEKKNAIAVNLMKPQYYSIPVTIISGSGSVITGKNGAQIFLTPFRSEAFGILPSELEKKKTAELRRLVKTIKPKISENRVG